MTMTVRAVTRDELPAFARTEFTAFGAHTPPGEIPAWAFEDLDRTVATFDGEDLVGTARVYSMELTVPGPATVPVAAVSAVGVLPTHRRRGVLTGMMREQLDDVAARGECIAALTASGGAIYRRFGYGVASLRMSFELDRRHSRFLERVRAGGECRLVDEGEARARFPAIFERVRREQTGAVSRPDAWWPSSYFEFQESTTGAGKAFHAVHLDEGGDADGYVTYAVEEAWQRGIARHRLGVRDLESATADGRRALWQFVCGVDLVETIATWNSPVDEPLRWMLAESRHLLIDRLADDLWLRLVDVPAALSARRYARDGDVVFDVHDGFRPSSGGRFRLRAARGDASCERVERGVDVDVACDTSELASAYLGGVTFADLARAGLVEERTPGALARADAMFASDRVPYAATWF
jgi:predicted acetyltransferase